MIFLDSLFRFSGVGMLLLLVVLTFRDLRHSQSALYLFLACISLSCVFLGYTPSYLLLPESMNLVIRFLDIPHLVFIWLFAMSLFQTEFKFNRFHLIVGVVYCLPILMARLAQYGLVGRFPFWAVVMTGVFSLLLMIHLIATTLHGRAGDLLERRRASRIYFVTVITYVTAAAVITDIVLVGQWQVYIYTAKVIIIWPAILWVCFWLFHIHPEVFAFGQQPTPNLESVQLDTRDVALIQKLEFEMVQNKAYLENGLSISVLAKKLATTQHTLRSLINKSLGHENFNTYVNTYRIDAIKEAFADPKNSHVPILTLALKFGFNSISPFNRAFSSIEGMTPSEYRKQKNHN